MTTPWLENPQADGSIDYSSSLSSSSFYDDGRPPVLYKNPLLAHDGNWLCRGHADMLVKLDPTPYKNLLLVDDESKDKDPTNCTSDGLKNFEQEEWEKFLADQQKAGGMLREDLEFIHLPTLATADDDPDRHRGEWERLQKEVLQPRNLKLASCISRRVAEGISPSKIRIQQLSDTQFNKLKLLKNEGNELFKQQKWQEAEAKYLQALEDVDTFFVAPVEQINQVVVVLSNLAECCLRLKDYQNAGMYATQALFFDNSHDKSRLRRAKAELAIAGAPRLIQAEYDLTEIVDSSAASTETESKTSSSVGVREAKKLLEQLGPILDMERSTMLQKQPPPSGEFDWDAYKGFVVSTCW
mmetsp:Transcript_50585/g.122073  ORF Transcript_50585/g.122073 Transcript_50585/m.122073 type:complete len:355 (-) Transcript_50585:370-1434(-)